MTSRRIILISCGLAVAAYVTYTYLRAQWEIRQLDGPIPQYDDQA